MTVERPTVPIVTEVTRYGPDGSHLTIEKIGANPTIFFVSGIHGDEQDIIEPLRRILHDKARTDPQLFGHHVRVLEANPAALQEGTRNVGEVDLNRQFVFKPAPDHPQAKLLADSLLEHNHVHTLFSFHEDPLEHRFYLYYLQGHDADGEMEPAIHSLGEALVSKVALTGVPLYNGIDDIDLGYWVNRGICAVAPDAIHDNSFETWSVQKELHGHPNMKHAFLFEIPGKLPIAQKEAVIQTIFDEFIEPYLAQENQKI